MSCPEDINEEKDTRTIIASGHFGDKEITKTDFIQQWLSHCNELKNINWNPEWIETISKLNVKVAAEAGKHFEISYKHQEENK